MKRDSLAARAVLALFLMVGFYLLAVSIAALLFYIPYAEMKYAEKIHIKLALGCVIGGLAILWSILPRFDKFEVPGPKLDPVSQKRLFQELRSIAKAAGQAMPSEVYMVPEVNAWVSQRGGIMGFGSKRVMGLGLPLMQALTLTQFRAVLAHEFGHYHGGDTRLGPWIYKTRGAIGRTLGTLGDDGILHLPFTWYGNFFMKITQAISRRQELQADELAARVSSPAALAGGLIACHRAGVAFDTYWQEEVVPILSAGWRPPIAEGFASFVSASDIDRRLSEIVDEELKGGEGDPFDSHPPLRERVDALRNFDSQPPPANDPPAASLLVNIQILELEWLRLLAGPEAAAQLKSLPWTKTADEVFLPIWKQSVDSERRAVAGVPTPAVGQLATGIALFEKKLKLKDCPPEYREAAAGSLLGSALAVALHGDGWVCDASPGRPVSFSKGELTLEPFSIVQKLQSGELTPDEWEQRCETAGLVALPLG